MLSKSEKRQIVNRLSSLLNTYNELSLVCDELKNNPEEVRKLISKIIKYGFTKGDFLFSNYSLIRISHDLDKIDEKYKEYIESKSKGLFSFFGKKTSKKEMKKDEERRKKLPFELDEDICLEDIEDLEIPEFSWIKGMCLDNISMHKSMQEKKEKQALYYKAKRGFDEVAFTYRRDDFVLINSSFIYQSDGLTGDVYDDYHMLYNGERYAGEFSKISPLNNSFEENLQIIRKSNDISLRKRGSVYEIENGRHRIIYLIRSANEVIIPISITRRIEDKEFNQKLINLKDTYGINIYKNNLLNDEPNVLLQYNGYAYPVNGNKGVMEFENAIKENKVDSLDRIPFVDDIQDFKVRKDYKDKYKMMTLKRVLDEGVSILEDDFSTFISHYKDAYEKINIPLFFEVYELMQGDLHKSRIYGYDFLRRQREEIKDRLGKDIDDYDEQL